MSRLDTETKRKLREMGVPALVDAFDLQDDALTMGLVLEERIKLAVDDAHAAFPHSKVEGLVRRAGLRYPNADLRRVDPPTDDVRSMLLELLERRYDATSTVFCTRTRRRTGTSASAAESTPTRSWTASSKTPTGSRPAT